MPHFWVKITSALSTLATQGVNSGSRIQAKNEKSPKKGTNSGIEANYHVLGLLRFSRLPAGYLRFQDPDCLQRLGTLLTSLVAAISLQRSLFRLLARPSGISPRDKCFRTNLAASSSRFPLAVSTASGLFP